MNSFNYSLLTFILLAFSCQHVPAQNYKVTESTMAYKHVNNDSIEITMRDILVDNDLISINDKLDPKGQQIIVTGSLAISLPSGNIKRVWGKHNKQKMKDLFFPSLSSRIKKAELFFMNLFKLPFEDDTKPAVHYQGQTDYLPGLEVSFVNDSIYYNSIDSIPYNSFFDIRIANKTDSIMCYAIACRNRTAYNDTTQFIYKNTDDEPIILVPGESTIIPSPFMIPEDYFIWSINIYGSPFFFYLKKNPNNDKTFLIETENLSDFSTIQRYYYDDNEN